MMQRRMAYPLLVWMCVFSLGVLPTVAHAVNTAAKQAYVYDMSTDTVLFEKSAHERMTPSSMSKLMTLYVVFDLIKQGRFKLEDSFPVSEKAWRMGGSKMFVQVGSEVSIEDLLMGVIVQSGNDACIVLAEGVSGTEEAFAAEMNKMAEKLGLEHSHFVNASGFPDAQHYMSARDLGVLSVRLIEDFPNFYPLFKEEVYTYSGIKQHNRNVLLGGPLHVDGLKTGHTEDGGYGIVVSAEEKDRRLVVVVNGLSSMKERANEADQLLKWGFHQFDRYDIAKPGDVLAEADVWMGKKPKVALTPEKPLVLTIQRTEKDAVKLAVRYDTPVQAPIVKGQKLGELVIRQPEVPERTVPLLAAEDVPELTGMGRLLPTLKALWLKQEPDAKTQESSLEPVAKDAP